jgi:hypothetical protein
MEQSAQNIRHGIRLPLGFVEIGGQEEIDNSARIRKSGASDGQT